MTHEPIHTVHLTPHITWQGTQAELDAMQAKGWPIGSASEIIAACKRDAAEANAYAEELEANLAKAVEVGVDVAASLSAALSLLEHGGKKAAGSDKMFAQMLVDYTASLDRFRITFEEKTLWPY